MVLPNVKLFIIVLEILVTAMATASETVMFSYTSLCSTEVSSSTAAATSTFTKGNKKDLRLVYNGTPL